MRIAQFKIDAIDLQSRKIGENRLQAISQARAKKPRSRN